MIKTVLCVVFQGLHRPCIWAGNLSSFPCGFPRSPPTLHRGRQPQFFSVSHSRAATQREDGGCKGEGGRLLPMHGLTDLCMYMNDTWHASEVASYAGGRSGLCWGSSAHHAVRQRATDTRQEQAGLTSTPLLQAHTSRSEATTDW